VENLYIKTGLYFTERPSKRVTLDGGWQIVLASDNQNFKKLLAS
jgi:hypothetical protein